MAGRLERLAEADHVIFDKTGTLTQGTPQLVEGDGTERKSLAIAAAMAAHSRHPYSLALAAAGRIKNTPSVALTGLSEHPGSGLEGRIGDAVYRLGRPEWALADHATPATEGDRPSVVLSENGRLLSGFHFKDELRSGAREAVAALTSKGLPVEILSGDREEPVRRLAAALDIPHVAQVSPAEKVAHVASIAAAGRKVLMVGDGLNDAPALVAAHVSMAPASAADVGRNAADFVFLRESLAAVPQAIEIARHAGRLVRQNLLLAVGYNAIAVPVAILGQVTPLLAAIAMSMSSIIVVGNALRLGRRQDEQIADAILRGRQPCLATAGHRERSDDGLPLPDPHRPGAGRARARRLPVVAAERTVRGSRRSRRAHPL